MLPDGTRLTSSKHTANPLPTFERYAHQRAGSIMPSPLSQPCPNTVFTSKTFQSVSTLQASSGFVAARLPKGLFGFDLWPSGGGQDLLRPRHGPRVHAGGGGIRTLLITVDRDIEVLRGKYAAFGWFTQQDGVFHSGRRVRIIPIDEGHLPQPTRGAEELINPVLAQVRRLQVGYPPARNTVFIVVDSITALVKDSRDPGDRQRNIQELINRLSEILSDRLGLVFLLSSSVPGLEPIGSAEEEIATFVLRLRSKDLDGHRMQVLDVRKSPEAAPMLHGDHSWEVLTPATLKEVIAFDGLRKEIEHRQSHPSQSLDSCDSTPPPTLRWGTVAIIPHPRLAPIGELQTWRAVHNSTLNTQERLFTGVPGMDEMLRRDADYWAQPNERIRRRNGEAFQASEDGWAILRILHVSSWPIWDGENLLLSSISNGSFQSQTVPVCELRKPSPSIYAWFQGT